MTSCIRNTDSANAHSHHQRTAGGRCRRRKTSFAATMGLRAGPAMLTSERDSTFRFAAADGQGYVLKIANAAEDRRQSPIFRPRRCCISQQVAPDLAVPRSFPRQRGRIRDFPRNSAAAISIVRMLSFLEGEPLYKRSGFRPPAPGTRRLPRLDWPRCSRISTIGLPRTNSFGTSRMPNGWFPLGRIHRRMRTGARSLAGFSTFSWNSSRRFCPPCAVQVVHNDFNPHNVLVDPANPDHVTGILDFGDMVQDAAGPRCRRGLVLPDRRRRSHPLRPCGGVPSAYHAVSSAAGRRDRYAVRPDRHAARHDHRHHQLAGGRYPENSAYILRNNPRARAAGAIRNPIP